MVGWQTEPEPAEKIEIEHGDGAVPIGKAPARVLVLALLCQLPPTIVASARLAWTSARSTELKELKAPVTVTFW